MRTKGLSLGLVLLCLLRVQAGELGAAEPDVSEIAGTWYITAMASDSESYLQKKDQLKMAMANIEVLEDGDLNVSFAIPTPERCMKFASIYKPTGSPGEYYSSDRGNKTVRLVDTDGSSYMVVMATREKDGKILHMLRLYSAWPAVVNCSEVLGASEGPARPRDRVTPLSEVEWARDYHVFIVWQGTSSGLIGIGGWGSGSQHSAASPWPWVSCLVEMGGDWGSCCTDGTESVGRNQERSRCAGVRNSDSSCSLGGVSHVPAHHCSLTGGPPPMPPAFFHGLPSIPPSAGHTHQLLRRCRVRYSLELTHVFIFRQNPVGETQNQIAVQETCQAEWLHQQDHLDFTQAGGMPTW